MSDELNKQLELAMAAIDREYGKGTIMKMDGTVEPWPAVSTGALTLDMELGIGGLPRGRIIEVYGPEGVGKSTLALEVVAEAQNKGDKCLYIDVENALDPVYMEAIGVNLDDLLISQPDYGEQALEVLLRMVNTGGLGLVVVDSVAALIPKAELDGTMEDQHMALQARMMSHLMRKLSRAASKNDTMVIFINQIREKVGIVYGNPETTPGGRALPFYSSVRVDLRRRDVFKNDDGFPLGIRVRAKIVKNKNASPFREAYFDIVFGKGINHSKSVIEFAAKAGVIQRAGAWYKYNDDNLGQGIDNACEYLDENPEIMKQIRKEVEEYVRSLR